MTPPAVCVAIMDEDNWESRTDILVVADAKRRTLTWVPRDLWSVDLGDRINMAFARHELLPRLAELGFPCHGLLCLRRGATIAALAGIEVEVPVEAPLDFWYPIEPTRPIEDGRKQVSFRPPRERLSGERLHQWIGARYAVRGKSSDLHRLHRQTLLVRALLAQQADFLAALADPELHRIEGIDPLPTLGCIGADWRMRVFARVLPATIDGKRVLRKATWPAYIVDRAKGLLAPLLRRGRAG